ncbi:MAG: DNA topoisomerase-3, partial [Myxococcota bacterium]
MGKQLVITEKPSVARDIAAALGGFDDHDEFLESEDYVVTFAVGHLLELVEPAEYDKVWRSWSVKNLPIIPEEFKIKPKEGQTKRLNLIKKLGKRKDVEGIINACDAGREGEMIFRRIAEFTGLDKKPSQRLWLQSMTTDAIKTG